jgi:HSP20 family protein
MVQEHKRKNRDGESAGNGEQQHRTKSPSRPGSTQRAGPVSERSIRGTSPSDAGWSRDDERLRDSDRSRETDSLRETGRPRETDRSRGMTPYSRGMSAQSSSPFALMSRIAQEMDRAFEGMWGMPSGDVWSSGRSRAPGGGLSALWMPEIEVHTHDGELVVRADLPGMKKDDVEVDVTDQVLTIQGERVQGCSDDVEGGYRSECRYGSFFRSIPLPEGVRAEDVTAAFENGVLEVRMPAPPRRENRRRIEVGSRKAEIDERDRPNERR